MLCEISLIFEVFIAKYCTKDMTMAIPTSTPSNLRRSFFIGLTSGVRFSIGFLGGNYCSLSVAKKLHPDNALTLLGSRRTIEVLKIYPIILCSKAIRQAQSRAIRSLVAQ